MIKYHFSGNTLAKTADTFSIGEKTVKRWKKEFKDNGEQAGQFNPFQILFFWHDSG
ncbi:MAG: DUF1804 family protein [Firmicutes bacterium]|nr:DUF1804 family protein [Bacillota bacterium]